MFIPFMSWMFHEMWLIILTPWIIIHLEKLTLTWLGEEFPIFYVRLSFMTWVISPLVCTLSQMNPVNILLSNFLNIDFSIMLPSVPLSSMWSHSVWPPYRNPVCLSLHVLPISTLPGFNAIQSGEHHQSCSSALRSFLHLPLTPSLSATNFLLST
jgi:hypothetical protein